MTADNDARSNVPSCQMNQRGERYHCEYPGKKQPVAQNGADTQNIGELGKDKERKFDQLKSLAEEQEDLIVVPWIMGEVFARVLGEVEVLGIRRGY
jgi:hypothetical protein